MSYIGNRPVDAIGVKSGAVNPPSGSIGELFFNTVASELVVWDGTAWLGVSGASTVPSGNSLPSVGATGQMFYLTTEDRIYVSTGTEWLPISGTPSGNTFPPSPNEGDTFYDTDTATLYIWNGTSWDIVGGGSNVNSGSVTPGSGSDIGQLFFNTVSEQLLVWDGTAWLVVSTVGALSFPVGPTLPGSASDGDAFYQTSDNKAYVYADGTWVSIMPGETVSGGTLPGGGSDTGELFFNTGDGTLYVWDGANWVAVGGTSVKGILVVATLPLSPDQGDVVFQTSDDTLYVWDGTNWVSLMGGGGTGVVVGTTLPLSGTNGDLFYQTSNNKLYVWSDTAWFPLMDAIAQIGTTFPSTTVNGMLFYNTTDSNMYIRSNSNWVAISSSSDGVPVDSSSSVSTNPTTSMTNVFVAPSTTGRRYIVTSIQVANISADEQSISGECFISSKSDSFSLGYKIPMPVGTSLELLKKPKVLNPSDAIRLEASNNGSLSTCITYTTSMDVKYFSDATDLTTTSTVDVLVASAKSRIDTILVSNDGESDAKITISWTNSSNAVQAYLAFEMVVPANSTIELLEQSKVIPSGHKIRATSTSENNIEVFVSGKQS